MNILDKVKGLFNKSYSGFTTVNGQVSTLNWSTTKYLKAYETSAYVYACVRKRAEKVGEIDFILKGANGEQILKHQVLELLAKPNPLVTKNEFFELYQIYKDLTGSSYIYTLRVGQQVKELHLLRPDWITRVNIDKETGLPSTYEYRTGNGQTMLFQAEDIIASRYPSPLQAFTGQSPLKAGAMAVDTEEQLAQYHYSVLKNGGKVEGILNFKSDNMTKQQIREIREVFAEQYAGAKNSSKPLVTYGDASYQNLGLNPTELSYIESKKMTRDDILLIYSVPKVIVAQTDDVNYSNAKVGKEVFLSETIRPLLEGLTNKLNEFLVPDNLELSFLDPTPEDVELKLKKMESGIRNYYMTPNEVREQLGLDPLEGGDDLLVPFNLMPMGMDSEPTNYNEPEETKKKKIKTTHPLQNNAVRAKYYENFLKKAKVKENNLLKAIKKYLKGQEQRVIESLTATQIKKKDVIDDVFNLGIEVDIAVNELKPILIDFLEQGGQDAMDLVGRVGKFRLTPKILSEIEKRVDLFALSMNKTTIKQLKKQLRDSLANTETLTELEKRLRDTYSGISKGRAGVIARTETQVATQSGQFEGYKQSGVEIKIWVWAPGVMGGVRDDHYMMDGEERPIDSPFSNGLMFPSDQSAPASEVVNCMCSI